MILTTRTKYQLICSGLAIAVAAGLVCLRGWPPSKSLYDASWQGDLSQARRAVSWGCRPRLTDLIQALETGHSDVAVLLIQAGVDVNGRNSSRSAPLHLAAEWGLTQVVQCLIDHGAEVNARDGNGETPLHGAARRNRKDVVDLLIARGASVDAESHIGLTSLDWAELMESTAVIKSLQHHTTVNQN